MWGLLLRAGSSLGSRLLLVGSRIRGLWSGAAGGSRAARFLRSMWKVLGTALTGWTIYDLFWGSNNEDTANELYSNMTATIFSRPVEVVLASNINDTECVGLAYMAAGSRLIDDQGDSMTLKGISIFAAGLYIQEVPYGGFYYEWTAAKKIITDDFSGFLQDQAGLTQADADAVASEFDLEAADMEYNEQRRFDFLAWLLSELGEVQITQPQVVQGGNNSGNTTPNNPNNNNNFIIVQ